MDLAGRDHLRSTAAVAERPKHVLTSPAGGERTARSAGLNPNVKRAQSYVMSQSYHVQRLLSGRLVQPRSLDSALPQQLLDLGDKCQTIQEPQIVAQEAAQSPPASTLNGLPCRGPCEPRSPFSSPSCLSVSAPAAPAPSTLINRPHWQIWIPLGFDWRRPLASINCASGVSWLPLKGGIKWCELL